MQPHEYRIGSLFTLLSKCHEMEWNSGGFSNRFQCNAIIHWTATHLNERLEVDFDMFFPPQNETTVQTKILIENTTITFQKKAATQPNTNANANTIINEMVD